MAAREGPVRERADRYASLHAALRAVTRLSSPVASDLDDRELTEPGLRELEGRLREAEHQGETSLGASGALLARIDAELDSLEADVVARLRALPPSQVRAAVPALRRSDPDGATSLLELCVETARQAKERGFADGVVAVLERESRSGLESGSQPSRRTSCEGDPEPLAAIAHELQRRLAGTTPGSGAAAQIAAALDVSRLSTFEKGVLGRLDGDPHGPALRSAVALRLVAPRLPKISERLASLGLDPAKLRRDGIPAISATLGAAISALVSARKHEDAKRVAELRGSLLAAWAEERPGGASRRPPPSGARLVGAPRVAPRRALPARATPRKWRLRTAVALAVAASFGLAVGAVLLR
jgi:hypothetical protein